MATAYTPPGINAKELSSPSTTPLLAAPASICLVGPSAGVITRTDAIKLTGTTAVTLPSVPTDATMTSSSIISVMDAVTPSLAPAGYVATTDYTFIAGAHTITRVALGAIPDGNTVYVTYTYTPADYFLPIRLDNMSDIQDRFGPAWDSTGTSINSALSFAAQCAFENGAQTVVLQPLFFNNSGVRQQPTNAQIAAAATWADNFTLLRDYDDINIIVPIIGQSMANVSDAVQLSVIQALQDHIKYMLDQQRYIIGIAAEDSSASSSVAQDATLITHAQTLAARYANLVSQQLALISPSKFIRPQPGAFGGTFYVGGQYMAAALAGMIAARDVSQSLTRKIVAGFVGVAISLTKTQMNTDASNGLLVVQQKGTIVRVRHSITLDTSSTAVRELSVVRSKHRVIQSISNTLDPLIGAVIADGEAPNVIAQAVQGVLEALKGTDDIVDYSGVQARTVNLDPTTIEVRFAYKPAFPVNYINIIFSLDLTNQQLTLPSTVTATAA